VRLSVLTGVDAINGFLAWRHQQFESKADAKCKLLLVLCHATQSEGFERPEEACGSPHLRFPYNIDSRIYSLAWALKINFKKTEAKYVTKKFDTCSFRF